MKSQPASLFHLIRPPLERTEEKPPLLLLLHGVGSNEEDLFGLAPMMDPRFFVVSARAPIVLYPGSYAWYHVTFTPQGPIHSEDEADESLEKLVAFLDEIVTAYDLDPQRVFVMGFSQGGAMTFSLAMTVPKKLAGAAILSGRTVPLKQSRMAEPEQLEGLHVMVAHGTEDAILPISCGHGLRDWFSKLPVDLTYLEYRMAHEITSRSLADIQEWLTARLD